MKRTTRAADPKPSREALPKELESDSTDLSFDQIHDRAFRETELLTGILHRPTDVPYLRHWGLNE